MPTWMDKIKPVADVAIGRNLHSLIIEFAVIPNEEILENLRLLRDRLGFEVDGIGTLTVSVKISLVYDSVEVSKALRELFRLYNLTVR